MENNTVLAPSNPAAQSIEDILTYFPDNPLRDPFAKAWISMTQTYTPFQIATFGSIIIHEVSAFINFFYCSPWGVQVISPSRSDIAL